VADETPCAWPTSPDGVPGDGDIKAGDRQMVTSRSIQLLRRA